MALDQPPRGRKTYSPLHGNALEERNRHVIEEMEAGGDRAAVAAKYDITPARVGQIMVASLSNRDALLTELQRHSVGGKVMKPLPEIVFGLGGRVTMAQATYLIKATLNRGGYLKYAESNRHDHEMGPFREIKLTEKGRHWKPGKKEEAKVAVATVETHQNGSIARDRTHFVGDECPGAHLEDLPTLHTVETPSAAPEEAVAVDPEPETAPQEPQIAETARFELTYPHIARLTAKKAELEAAAKVLEAHGLNDAALTALEAAEPKDGLERDILRYLAAQGQI